MQMERKPFGKEQFYKSQEGAIGYILAWLLGVPASILLVIWVIRGFD